MKKIIIVIMSIIAINANAQVLGDMWEEEKKENLTVIEEIKQDVYNSNTDLGDMFEAQTGLTLNIEKEKIEQEERKREAAEFKEGLENFNEKWEDIDEQQQNNFIAKKKEEQATAIQKIDDNVESKNKERQELKEKRARNSGSQIIVFADSMFNTTIKPLIKLVYMFLLTSVLMLFAFSAFGAFAQNKRQTQPELKQKQEQDLSNLESYKKLETNRIKTSFKNR
jgi:hypothetical protein